MHCNVCNTLLHAPLFVAASERAMTSLCEVRAGTTKVWSCPACTHLRGEALPDTGAYYESEYRILLNHDDEDQIYEKQGEKIVYRTDHQVATLLDKVDLKPRARLLDYGCAKASTPQRLLTVRSDLQVHLFDVSPMYQDYWRRFASSSKWAIHATPADWQHSFDIVTSFFALEHIPAPLDTVAHIASLLADDGVFYGIVPDTFGNVADFVVIDHVNHFTTLSLHTLLTSAGFTEIHIDENVHRGALVFSARKSGSPTSPPAAEPILRSSRELADYWSRLDDRIRASEVRYGGQPAAIYGSGFYGAYIASALRSDQDLQCFLDASPFQQGKRLFGHPVLAPTALPCNVRVLYMGLNPKIARHVAADMRWLTERQLQLVFIDEEAE